MHHIGSDLLKQSKAFREDEKHNKSSGRKDILSLLLQANAMQDIPEAPMYLLNILAEFTTFLIAGHETASIAMAWALYALTHNKQAQRKFRQEVSNLLTDNPTIGDLNGLPYLDAVVHETLRLYPPVSSTIRAAQEMISFLLASRSRRRKALPERCTNILDVATSVPAIWVEHIDIYWRSPSLDRLSIFTFGMEIYVYDISNMRLFHVIEITPNPEAICALSPSADSSYLAYPSPVPSPMSLATAANGSPSIAVASSSTSSQHQSGDVLFFSTRTLTVANVIQAHKSPFSFNPLSTLPRNCISSDGGTREARIYSMNFNLVSSLLAVSSVHDTVHIFKLGQQPASKNNSEASNSNQSSSSPPESVEGASPPPSLEGGYESFIEKKKSKSISSNFNRRSLQLTKSLTHSMGGYLPNSLTEMWEPSRDFAFLRLPTSGTRSIVAFSGTMPHVMVISSDGYFYSYSIDLEKGGECSLMKQYSLLDSGEESSVLDGK
ncbi:p450-domain-containing protein [Phlegmacium glaucopus]|nr:p450-domain-containing protein [Phlegmacium glaucopus]